MSRQGPIILAALNGDRFHPATPHTPHELAREARAAVDAGAVSVHIHPYDANGEQTLEAAACAAAIRAVRAECPGVPISLTTFAAVEPDPARRLELVAQWTEQPELVTANQGERGVLELCELLLARGVGIEAGLLTLADAHAFVLAGIADRCVRVLLEPLDADAEVAVAHAAAMEKVLDDAGITLPQVHHGEGVALWAVTRRAAERGHGIRTGLEDTSVLPDGTTATGNAQLVAAAAEILRAAVG